MAYATITMSNEIEIKKVPLGFSWTTFFFGGWPAVIRQDWIPGCVLIALCLFTYGLAGVVAAFLYNNYYAKSLLEKGFKIHTLPEGITEDMVKAQLGLLKFPYEV
jgi:NADH:ubiquinone oxidoreductase subunit H